MLTLDQFMNSKKESREKHEAESDRYEVRLLPGKWTGVLRSVLSVLLIMFFTSTSCVSGCLNRCRECFPLRKKTKTFLYQKSNSNLTVKNELLYTSTKAKSWYKKQTKPTKTNNLSVLDDFEFEFHFTNVYYNPYSNVATAPFRAQGRIQRRNKCQLGHRLIENDFQSYICHDLFVCLESLCRILCVYFSLNIKVNCKVVGHQSIALKSGWSNAL